MDGAIVPVVGVTILDCLLVEFDIVDKRGATAICDGEITEDCLLVEFDIVKIFGVEAVFTGTTLVLKKTACPNGAGVGGEVIVGLEGDD